MAFSKFGKVIISSYRVGNLKKKYFVHYNVIFIITRPGSCLHSPSTKNLYWCSPSGKSIIVTKSPWLLTIGRVFHSLKVPLMNTCLPPPSHLNTVGRNFLSFFLTLVPSETVLERGRGSNFFSSLVIFCLWNNRALLNRRYRYELKGRCTRRFVPLKRTIHLLRWTTERRASELAFCQRQRPGHFCSERTADGLYCRIVDRGLR